MSNNSKPQPADASTPIIFMPPSSSSPPSSSIPAIPIGRINFVAQGRPGEPAKFCVVDKEYPVRNIANRIFLNKFQLSKPEVLISITGSAFDFTMRSSKLEQIFNRGLLKAAQNTKAWIVTGGSDSGVMKRVGQAIRGQDQMALVPCIGIASFCKVTNNRLLDPKSKDPVMYVPDKQNDANSAALNPDHTHFILVTSKDDEWGQEIKFRTELEDYISRKSKVPLVLVAINGGPGTVETIAEGVTRGFPIIIVDGSGRACDFIAAYIHHCKDPKRYTLEVVNQLKSEVYPNITPDQQNKLEQWLQTLKNKIKYITIFNPNESETEDMDKTILRSIFTCHESSKFEHKLKLGVKWGRADVLEELFQQYDSSVAADVKAQALSVALNESLKRNKPDIYELLVSKGAGLDFVDIVELYKGTSKQIERLSTFAGLSVKKKQARKIAAQIEDVKGTELADRNVMTPRELGASDTGDGSRLDLSTASNRLDVSTVSNQDDEGALRESMQHHEIWTEDLWRIKEDTDNGNELTSDSRIGSVDSTSGSLRGLNASQIDPDEASLPLLPPSPISSPLPARRASVRIQEPLPNLTDARNKGKKALSQTQLIAKNANANEKSPLLRSDALVTEPETLVKPTKNLEEPGKILRAINPRYAHLLEDQDTTYTDILIWAILADRFELAKAVWRRTKFTVHSALVACHLYKVIGDWFRDEVYKKQYMWFESVAIEVLSEMKYEEAVKILEWEWEELDRNDALSIAEGAECKDFFSTAQVQRNLDEKFHSLEQKNVQILPGTKFWKILLMMITFTLYHNEAYCSIRGTDPPKKITYFYSLPVVKLLSSSVSYIMFLTLLIVNLILIDPAPSNAARFDIMWWEWVLWAWLLSSLVEEVNQFLNDPKKHFTQISNRMDFVMYGLLMIYFVMRIIAWEFREQAFLFAYTDMLVISTIACFIRFMNVFAVSKSLGPLFFVIIRLFNDVAQWLFIFLLFMLSFQAGIFAFTRQAGHSGWEFYPYGSLGAGFTAILGDLGEKTMEWMTETRFGVVVILLYSLVTQVMLVNLLIAMMGSTYTAVRDNSDKEWKFYRYRLINDYKSSSPCPPPFSAIYIVWTRIRHYISPKSKPEPDNTLVSSKNKNVERIMKNATERVIEKHDTEEKYGLPSVSGSIHERMRLLTTQRDSDRLYLEQLEDRLIRLEKKMENSEKASEKLDGNIQTILSILQSLQK